MYIRPRTASANFELCRIEPSATPRACTAGRGPARPRVPLVTPRAGPRAAAAHRVLSSQTPGSAAGIWQANCERVYMLGSQPAAKPRFRPLGVGVAPTIDATHRSMWPPGAFTVSQSDARPAGSGAARLEHSNMGRARRAGARRACRAARRWARARAGARAGGRRRRARGAMGRAGGRAGPGGARAGWGVTASTTRKGACSRWASQGSSQREGGEATVNMYTCASQPGRARGRAANGNSLPPAVGVAGGRGTRTARMGRRPAHAGPGAAARPREALACMLDGGCQIRWPVSVKCCRAAGGRQGPPGARPVRHAPRARACRGAA